MIQDYNNGFYKIIAEEQFYIDDSSVRSGIYKRFTTTSGEFFWTDYNGNKKRDYESLVLEELFKQNQALIKAEERDLKINQILSDEI